MTGKIGYTPEGENRDAINVPDNRFHKPGSNFRSRGLGDPVTRGLGGAVAGRSRDDIRRGVRITSFRKKTVVAYEVDESADDPVINILGVFHGGQDWETTLRDQLAEADLDATGGTARTAPAK